MYGRPRSTPFHIAGSRSAGRRHAEAVPSRPPRQDDPVRRAIVPLLALTVGFVLADSAIVTLALPDILQNLGGTVAQVAWVLIAFNLVLALVVVPAAWAFGRDPAPLCAAGIAVFAGAS